MGATQKRNRLLLFIIAIFILFNTRLSAKAAETIDSTTEANITSETEEKQTDNNEDTLDLKPALADNEIKLGKGGVKKLEVNNISPQAILLYEVSDPEIAEVDNTGNIKALNVGMTQIKVTVYQDYQAYELKASLTVLKDTKIEFSNQTISLKVGDTHQLSWVLIPEDTMEIAFTSENEEVATVNTDGLITAKKAGSVVIRATLANGESTSISVVVTSELKSIKILYISKNAITLGKGQARTLHYQVKPDKLSKLSMTWTSSNEKIATVDENGKVTAIKEGKATITLTANDGSGIKTAITVKVKKRGKKNTFSESGLSVVDSSKAKYTYTEMVKDLKELQKKYGDILQVKTAGQSYDSRNIYEVILGNPQAEKKIFVQSTIHGREYMTTLLTMKQIELYCKNYYTGMFNKQYYSELFDEVAFYIVPMANPDGVTISQKGAKGIKNDELRKKIETMCKKYGKGKSSYYTTWKANARGVDLNRNFNGYWKLLKNGVKKPQAYNYKGASAASEKETKILIKLVNEINPICTISYHATGSILYWDFGQEGDLRKESKKLVNLITSLTGYDKISSYKKSSSSGFSDWVSIRKGLPAVTIEIGEKSCPLKIKEFKDIWKKNKMLYPELANMYNSVE